MTYTLDSDGLLTISGKGKMKNYDNYSNRSPWFYYKNGKVNSVVIENCVTCIGNCAFNGCGDLISVEIPSSVTSINYYAFGNCSSLTSIEIPNRVTGIGYGAFKGCDNLKDVYYYGDEYEWSRISKGGANSCLYNANIHFILTNFGDTNGDGEITAADAVLFAQHFAGWATNIDLSAMDLNNDGYVNAADLVLLSQYLAGWGIKLGEKN